MMHRFKSHTYSAHQMARVGEVTVALVIALATRLAAIAAVSAFFGCAARSLNDEHRPTDVSEYRADRDYGALKSGLSKASKLAVGLPKPGTSVDTKRAHARAGSEALSLARGVLSGASTASSGQTAVSKEIVVLARLCLVSGEIAQHDSAMREAMQCYLDGAYIASLSTNGGNMVEQLKGMALVEECCLHLGNASSTQGKDDIQVAVGRIDVLNKIIEPAEAVMQRETKGQSLDSPDVRLALERQVIAVNKCRTCIDLAKAALMLRLYVLNHDRLPAVLSDLAASGLPPPPFDRFSAGEFRYEQSDRSYRLYSVGPNGKDDGGSKKAATTSPSDDIVIEGTISDIEPIK